MNAAPLSLRDIHLPEPISWWPPAPGWWIVAIVTIAAVTLLIRWYRPRAGKLAVRRIANHELRKIKRRYQQSRDAGRLARELSILLRRVAMSLAPREAAAGLTGEQWLNFLDSLVTEPLFNSDTGRQLTTAPYRPAQSIDARALLSLSERWLELSATRVPHAGV